eukprot:403331526
MEEIIPSSTYQSPKHPFYTFPPIFNSLDNYTVYLNEQQNEVFYKTQLYGFDFKEQPSAFSQQILKEQAAYVAASIQKIMSTEFDKNDKFSLFAHSMGSVVAYLAMSSSKFPINQLQNVFTLAGPLEEAPQLFNDGIAYYINKVAISQKPEVFENILHVNFHGGPRDQLVSQSSSNFNRFRFLQQTSHDSNSIEDQDVDLQNPANYLNFPAFKYALNIKANQLKNVYQSMDHNSLFYYKHFWDVGAPIIVQTLAQKNDKASERYELVKSLLEFNIDKVINIGMEELSQNRDVKIGKFVGKIAIQKEKLHLNEHKPISTLVFNKKQLELIVPNTKQNSEAYQDQNGIFIELNLDQKQNDLNNVLRIQTNIDRRSKIQLVLTSDTLDNKLVEIIGQTQYRVHHQKNLLILNLNMTQLNNLVSNQNYTLQVHVMQQTKQEYEKNLFNLSPCSDKTNPIIYKPVKESYMYLEEEKTNKQFVNNLIVMKSSDSELNELFFVNPLKNCVQTYPMRRTSTNLIIAIGSILDQATETSDGQIEIAQNHYSLLKHQNAPFTFSKLDLLIITPLIYLLAFALSLAFELIIKILKFLFVNKLFKRQNWLATLLHYIFVILGFAGAYFSYKFHLYFGAVTVLVILAIDLTIRTNQVQEDIPSKSSQESDQQKYQEVNHEAYALKVKKEEVIYEQNIQNVLLPIVVFLGQFIDKYIVEIWRFQDNGARFKYHYQEMETQYYIPCLLYMLILLICDLQSIRSAYQTYGRYLIVAVSFFAMIGMGKFTHRVRPVFSLIMLGLSNLIIVKAAFGKNKQLVNQKPPKQDAEKPKQD